MGQVQSLLTPSQFAARIVGAPWVRWRSDYDGADCFGLLTLYFREVLGVVIDAPRDVGGDHGFTEWRGWESQWVECSPEAGATCWMAWQDGAPTHCGVLLSANELLHSEASPTGGSVRVSRLSAIRRLYGELRFYRYCPC